MKFSHKRRNILGLAALTAAAVAAVPASPTLGGTFRHDVQYDDGTTVWRDLDAPVMYGDGFHMVGGVQVDFTSFGTGVMIAPQWVVTAAHVVAGVTPGTYVKFETDPDPDDPVFEDPDYNPENWETLPLSGLFRVDALAIHEYYDDALGPAGGFDIALLHLDAPISHTDPDFQPYELHTGNPIGQQGTPVGFGATGTGQTGYLAETGAFFRLAGDNMIDGDATDPRILGQFFERDVIDPITGNPVHFTAEQIAAQFLLSDFDDPPTQLDDPSTPLTDESHTNDGLNPLGSSTALGQEYSVAPGDSGGPLLIKGLDGKYRVAGLNSFIHGLPAPDGDGTDNATYSDLQGYLRLDLFKDWIDAVLASTPIIDPIDGDVDGLQNLTDPDFQLSSVVLANQFSFEGMDDLEVWETILGIDNLEEYDIFELLELLTPQVASNMELVPEPAALSLLMPAALLLGRRRRRT